MEAHRRQRPVMKLSLSLVLICQHRPPRAKMATLSKPALLDLPLEIKALIYGHLFEGAKLVSFCDSEGTMTQHKINFTFDILGTCKAIREEAGTILYRELHFHMYNIPRIPP